MSNKDLPELLEEFGNKTGLSFQLITNCADGNITVNKKGLIKLPVILDVLQVAGEKKMTPELQDLRRIFPPQLWDNKLVPLLVFVDPIKFQEFMKSQE